MICLVSGVVKVLWMLIAAVAKKNIWLMFVQMRIFMPIGFIILITTLIVDRTNLNGSAILAGLLSFPSCIFFAIGVIGMILMTVLAFKADSSNPKVDLTEQFIIPRTVMLLCMIDVSLIIFQRDFIIHILIITLHNHPILGGFYFALLYANSL